MNEGGAFKLDIFDSGRSGVAFSGRAGGSSSYDGSSNRSLGGLGGMYGGGDSGRNGEISS